jgi:hypothetical protein
MDYSLISRGLNLLNQKSHSLSQNLSKRIIFYKPLKIKYLPILFGLIWGLTACQNDACQDPAALDKLAQIKINLKVVRLEDELFALKSKAEIQKFLQKNALFARRFYRYAGIDSLQNADNQIAGKNIIQNKLQTDIKIAEEKKTELSNPKARLRQQKYDSVIVDAIFRMINTPEIKEKVLKQCQAQFKDISDIQAQFTEAFRHLKYYYGDFKTPTIYTTITGLGSFLGNDLFISEDAIVISLDFFLTKNQDTFRPPVDLMPDYIWQRYHRQAIVPNCVKYISNRYNQTDFNDKTVLAEMIYHGKAYQFTKMMLPCTPDSLLIGYTQAELANIKDEANRNFIWNHIIEKKVLFSNNHFVKQTYLEERPFVAEINRKCPGRIGQWLGWRIVQKYLQKNPDFALQSLMRKANAAEIFNNSGYQGD